MSELSITLSNRKAPWEVASWEDGQKPLPAGGELLTATDMLEASGLAGWDVALKDIYVGRKGPKVDSKRAVVATGGPVAGQVLGVMGRAYVPTQIEELFDLGEKIVDDGKARWERAGYFRNGSKVFGCMEIVDGDISVPGDDSPIKPYLLLATSFDGSCPNSGILAFIRPVCINTWQAAYATPTPNRFKIRHTSTLSGKIQMARDAIGITFKHREEVRQLTERLATSKLVDEQVLAIYRKAVWPVDADELSEGRLEEHSSTRAFENYLTSPTLDGIRGTGWGALNGVTEFVDHIAEYKGGPVFSADDVRGDSLLFGRAETRKERALTAILKAIR